MFFVTLSPVVNLSVSGWPSGNTEGLNPLCRRLSVSVTVFACFCVWVGLCVYVYCKKDVQKCVCVSV